MMLPNLRGADEIGFDGETYDPGLQQERGSSWAWGDGHICGTSVAWREGGDMRSLYIPLRHPDTDNVPVEQFSGWMRDLVVNSSVTFVGQGTVYDWGWARKDLGVPMPGAERLYDVGVAAALIDENHYSYSLDSLCQRAGLPGKDEAELRQAVEVAGFAAGRKKGNPQEHIWRLPGRYVARYAEVDAIRVLQIKDKTDSLLGAEGLRPAFELDMALLPVTLEMRLRGIRVDQDAAEQARDYCLRRRDAVLAELSAQHGKPLSMDEINGRKWKIQTFDAYGIDYPFTENGNPSFKAGRLGWMTQSEHWLPRGIIAARRYHDAAEKFLEGYILGHIINGRVHAEIHSFKAEDGGARTSRFSYSSPPLQQTPKNDVELAPVIRRVFLPEEGGRWYTPDYRQQEFVHVIDMGVQHRLPGAREAAETYCNDENCDFHVMVADIIGRDRTTAKNCNFGKIYGMGLKAFARAIGRSMEETRAILAEYDRRLPFVWRLAKRAQDMAERLGYTEFGDGCRRHWNLYEAAGVFAKGAGPCSLEEALRRRADLNHPWYRARLQRAGTFRALNAAIQGASARQTKQWIVDCHREGIVPLLQMHDALECSVATRAQAEMIARLGIDAVQISIPMRIEQKFGTSWGDAKYTWDECPAAPARKPAAAPAKPATKPFNGARLRIEAPASDVARAFELWESAEPLAGTPAAHYLADDCLVDLAALPDDIDDVLRCGPAGCLLALMHDALSGEPTGVLRIAEGARATLGRAGVVKVWRAASQLVVGEDLETVLAVATRLRYRGAPLQPAWAVPALDRFPVIDSVERLILLDHNGAGEACKRRWAAAGRAGVRLSPQHPHTSFHDIIAAEGAA